MASTTRSPGNLPAEATSFIGRRRELAEVRKKLAEARLVSLVGAGGVGKTRLAMRAAADLGRGFRHGAWLVELAEVRDPSLVSNALVSALDLRDQAAPEPLALLLSYLQDKELLLLVDNCEHLLGAAADAVTAMMKAAPGLKVIATSREPLTVQGEHVVPVPPLELPAPDAEPLARLLQNEAVMLFVERAAAASGSFELTTSNQSAVVDLCRRLDGVPLAIELAAVRTRALTAEQILERLTDRFSLLTGGGHGALPRHQTLRTAIEWSHDLLTSAERVLLRRCCAFGGRFTLEDVESVCLPEEESDAVALDLLSSLVDKSLLVKEDARSLACYRLHETMREFARVKLTEAGEEEAVGLRCVKYYRRKCQLSAVDVRFRMLDWLAWADLEIDNIRAVLQQCAAHADAQRGIDIALGLSWYWVTRATSEGTRWLDGFLAADGGDQVVHGWAHFIRGFLAVLTADPATARPALHQAMKVARQAGQPGLLSEALAMASIAEGMTGDHASAKRLLGEAQVATADNAGILMTISVLQARSLNGLAEADPEAVRLAASEGVRLAEEAGDLYALEMMLLNLGSAALIAGELDEARPFLERALRIAGEIDDRVAQQYILYGFAVHAALTGQARLGAQLLGAAQIARTEVGASLIPFLEPLLARAEDAAVAALGAARFEAEMENGKSLGRHVAMELALGATAPGTDPAAADDSLAPLGKREADVARLVADGLTNKQIGTRLFISERTVDTHVRNILNKLGFSSRAQIAAWMASDGR
ncbi:MAG: LuxR family transcriptional regulator [Actinobacteria bacterium]|nr:LuxR family transcriptional regulator [Actinomycetota bacterium]